MNRGIGMLGGVHGGAVVNMRRGSIVTVLWGAIVDLLWNTRRPFADIVLRGTVSRPIQLWGGITHHAVLWGTITNMLRGAIT